MPTMTTLVDGTVPVAADFNGNFSALNAAIGTATSISAWALGELPYASAASTLSRLTPGSTGQVLTMQGTGIPGWSTAVVTDQLTGLGMANGTDAVNDIDIAVGAAASDDATVANRLLMNLTGGLTKQLDAAWAVGTNQGGLDTGAIANGTYHVFLIERTDTGVVDALFSTSATAPTMPTNYTKKRRIGSIIRAAGTILAFDQFGDDFYLDTPGALDVNTSNPGTSAVTATLNTPVGVVNKAYIHMTVENATSSTTVPYVSALASADVAPSLTATPLSSIGTSALATPARMGGQRSVWTNTSSQIRYRLSASGAADVVRIVTLGWMDRRGKG